MFVVMPLDYLWQVTVHEPEYMAKFVHENGSFYAVLAQRQGVRGNDPEPGGSKVIHEYDHEGRPGCKGLETCQRFILRVAGGIKDVQDGRAILAPPGGRIAGVQCSMPVIEFLEREGFLVGESICGRHASLDSNFAGNLQQCSRCQLGWGSIRDEVNLEMHGLIGCKEITETTGPFWPWGRDVGQAPR